MTVANYVEFMDGPCEGKWAARMPLNITDECTYVYQWYGDELVEYELRAGNKAYWVHIDKGRD